MRLAMVGLGKMGGGMARRLLEGGHDVVVYDIAEPRRAALADLGASPVASLDEAVAALDAPRVLWMMLPAGPVTHDAVTAIGAQLTTGDVIVDGGNSPYRDAMAAADHLRTRGAHFVDAGVSGGVWGLEAGYCLMVGGDTDAVETIRPALETLAPDGGFAHVGPTGAGHFTKMVHNGIEYGMMQAYAEGFELLASAGEFGLDLHQIGELWRHGSVVRSWLLDLAVLAFADKDGFSTIRGYVQDSGEGRWTVEEGVRRAVPLPVITAALFARFASRQEDALANRILAALRNQFGGHAVVREEARALKAAALEEARPPIHPSE